MMTRRNRLTHSSSLSLAISLAGLALVGCPASEDPSGAEASSESGQTPTDSSTTSSAGSTETSDPSAGSTETGSESVGETSTGADETSGSSDPSTGGSSDGDTATTGTEDSPCAEFCGWVQTCQMEAPNCESACEEYISDSYAISRSCGDARTALVECRGNVDNCPQFGSGCQEERQQVAESCEFGTDEEGCGEVGEAGGDECEYSYDCDAGRQEIECASDVCTCIVDGMPTGECSLENACGIGMEELGLQCCGFEDFGGF